MYRLMELPPLLTGAVQVTFAEPLPRVAATLVGGSGTASGVTVFDGAEGSPVPLRFVAVTVNEYEWPLVRPLTRQLVAPEVVHPNPAGDEETV